MGTQNFLDGGTGLHVAWIWLTLGLILLCGTKRKSGLTPAHLSPKSTSTWLNVENTISYHILLTNIHLELFLLYKFVWTKIFLAQTFLPHQLPAKSSSLCYFWMASIIIVIRKATFQTWKKNLQADVHLTNKFVFIVQLSRHVRSPDSVQLVKYLEMYFLNTFVIRKHWDRQYRGQLGTWAK